MLVQFTVTNFKSFGAATTISMVPAPHVQHTADQVIETGVPTVPQLLRVAVVYGRNGAGWLLKEPGLC